MKKLCYYISMLIIPTILTTVLFNLEIFSKRYEDAYGLIFCFTLFLIFCIWEKLKEIYNKNGKHIYNIKERKMKNIFKEEMFWRLFIVLQTIGMIMLFCYIKSNWGDTLPSYSSYRGFRFSSIQYNDGLFGGWSRWSMIVFSFGPFLLAKAIDWVYTVKDKEKESGVKEQKSIFFKDGQAVYDYSKKYLTHPTELTAGNEHTGIIKEIDNDKVTVTIVVAAEEQSVIAHKLDFQKEAWHTLKVDDAILLVPIVVRGKFMINGVISAKLTNEYVLSEDGWKTEWAFDVTPLLAVI